MVSDVMQVSFYSPSAQICVFDVHGPWCGSTMSGEPDALAVVNQLRDLAADPLNRRAIVEDQGCLSGLILFFDHPNPQVVYSALLVRFCLWDICSQDVYYVVSIVVIKGSN